MMKTSFWYLLRWWKMLRKKDTFFNVFSFHRLRLFGIFLMDNDKMLPFFDPEVTRLRGSHYFNNF